MTDLTLLGDNQSDKLAGLVFELAAQLHIERTRRQALEEILIRNGILNPTAIEALATDADFQNGMRDQLDQAIRRLLTIASEAGDPAAPLREEAPRDG